MRQKIQSSKHKESEFISKNVGGKRKEIVFKRITLLIYHVKGILTLLLKSF